MFKTVKRERLSDEIVRQFKDALLAGQLQAGDRLPTERSLAEQAGASRASIREALRTLEQEGVISIKKGVHGGIFVADFDHRPVARSLQNFLQFRKISIHQIAEARLIFEPMAARLAAERATPEDLREMERVIEQMSEAVKNRELPRSFDLKFHLLVARAAANPIVEMLAEAMLEVASATITKLHPSVDTLRHVLASHRQIFDAIQKRDGQLAFQFMHEHIVDVQARLARRARNGDLRTRQKIN